MRLYFDPEVKGTWFVKDSLMWWAVPHVADAWEHRMPYEGREQQFFRPVHQLAAARLAPWLGVPL